MAVQGHDIQDFLRHHFRPGLFHMPHKSLHQVFPGNFREAEIIFDAAALPQGRSKIARIEQNRLQIAVGRGHGRTAAGRPAANDGKIINHTAFLLWDSSAHYTIGTGSAGQKGQSVSYRAAD